MKISVYGHSGSYNHGNEAIVRGVKEIFNEKEITCYSFNPQIDYKYKLNKVCKIKPFFDPFKRFSRQHILSSIYLKLTRDIWMYYRFYLRNFLKEVDGVYLLEAGDQYCENSNLRKFYAFVNKSIKKRGGKTIMLGCTINEAILQDKNVIKDLKNYSLIIARESITYNALIKAGVNKNTHLAPDPAFIMKSEECSLSQLYKKEVVGVNFGFLKQGNEQFFDLMIQNSINLVDHILQNTNLNVVLIPHVNWGGKAADFESLNIVYEKFKNKYSSRIELTEERSANQQKFIMSQCKFIIALRTHVAISSIASQVPTIITGYKVKSTGINQDIFPPHFQLLADVASLKTENDYIDFFKWVQENESEVRQYMDKKIPAYIDESMNIKQLVEAL